MDTLYCVLGVWQTDSKGQPEFTRDMLKTIVHEFCHSYANPIIDRHAAKLQAAGEKIFPHVAARMKRQAYGNWRTMLYESLVRASTLRYVRHHDGEEAALLETAKDKARGFLWIDQLSKLLGEYETDRKRYPTMEAFAPRLVEFFDGVAAKMGDHVVKGPKVVSISPANGQTGVDPALTRIQVVFDRPMRDRSWSLVGGGPNCPKLTGKMWYDARRTTWTAEVKLKPEWTYRFMLNSDRFTNFRSADGVPLVPVNVTFTTGKAKK